MHTSISLVALTALLVASSVARAQSPSATTKKDTAGTQAGAPASAKTSIAGREKWMASVNPVGLVYGGISGEAERPMGEKRSAAIAANYWGYVGWNYLSLDLKYRFYRDPAKLRGLSYGPLVGIQSAGTSVCDTEYDQVCRATGLTVGGTVDYAWRLGAEEKFSAIVGGGLKMALGMNELSGVRVTYPFVRLGIGYVFPRQ